MGTARAQSCTALKTGFKAKAPNYSFRVSQSSLARLAMQQQTTPLRKALQHIHKSSTPIAVKLTKFPTRTGTPMCVPLTISRKGLSIDLHQGKIWNVLSASLYRSPLSQNLCSEIIWLGSSDGYQCPLYGADLMVVALVFLQTIGVIQVTLLDMATTNLGSTSYKVYLRLLNAYRPDIEGSWYMRFGFAPSGTLINRYRIACATLKSLTVKDVMHEIGHCRLRSSLAQPTSGFDLATLVEILSDAGHLHKPSTYLLYDFYAEVLAQLPRQQRGDYYYALLAEFAELAMLRKGCRTSSNRTIVRAIQAVMQTNSLVLNLPHTTFGLDCNAMGGLGLKVQPLQRAC